MKLQDATMLGDWLYEQRLLVKAYKGDPGLLFDLLAGSLAARIRKFDRTKEQNWADQFWDRVGYGPLDGQDTIID